jgi:hypothetical protein
MDLVRESPALLESSGLGELIVEDISAESELNEEGCCFGSFGCAGSYGTLGGTFGTAGTVGTFGSWCVEL